MVRQHRPERGCPARLALHALGRPVRRDRPPLSDHLAPDRLRQLLDLAHDRLHRLLELDALAFELRHLRLEALLAIADKENSLLISGNGDVIEPDEGILAIGSGGVAAQAAAKALTVHTAMTAREIVEAAMRIAADICVFTNQELTIEEA